jgi:hypothetical protein
MPEALFDLDRIGYRTANVLAIGLLVEQFTIIFLFQTSGYIINHSQIFKFRYVDVGHESTMLNHRDTEIMKISMTERIFDALVTIFLILSVQVIFIQIQVVHAQNTSSIVRVNNNKIIDNFLLQDHYYYYSLLETHLILRLQQLAIKCICYGNMI